MTRFTAGVVLLGWAACAAYPLGLLLAASPADFSFLRTAFGHIPYMKAVWYPQLVSPLQVHHVCLLLALAVVLLGGMGLVLLRSDWQHRYQLRGEWITARSRVRQAWTQLSLRQQHGLVASMLVVIGLRLLLSCWLTPEDDAYSYRMFVRHPLLLISSCYPIPNNHVLTNSISHLFYLVHPGFWWSMRLPVVLLGTAGTLGWYLLLLVRTNFRVASLAVGVFSCLQLSLFNAAQGRGYWLLLALSGLGFDSVLRLSASLGRRRQWPWLALGLLGPLGLYTVPTFAYFLFSAYSWLTGWWLVRRAWRAVGQVGLLLAGTLLAALLLYAPLLLVSGFGALVHNPYVRPATDVTAYWHSLPAELWVMEGRLTVEKHVGGVLALGVIGGGTYLARREWQAARQRATLAWVLPLLSLWFILSPYLLMMVQRVRAPERTLLYKSQFFFLLGAVLLERLVAQRGARGGRWQKCVLSLLLLGWLLLQVVLLYRFNESIKAYGEPGGLADVFFRFPVVYSALPAFLTSQLPL
jgi:hypothetical protein